MLHRGMTSPFHLLVVPSLVRVMKHCTQVMHVIPMYITLKASYCLLAIKRRHMRVVVVVVTVVVVVVVVDARFTRTRLLCQQLAPLLRYY